MKKESFIVPFLIMLLLASYATIVTLELVRFYISSAIDLPWYNYVFLFCWPILFFCETYIYWHIRKNIRNRNVVWGHVICVTFALVSFPLVNWVMKAFFGSYYLNGPGLFEMGKSILTIYKILFWTSMVVGHISFVRVLSKAFLKKQSPSGDKEESVNLLDDFVS
ncbi:MAG TPA: hypothetical protein VNU72_10010 [Puia sp.]|nr:hypothetical protein [Puia sp.]